MRKSHLMATLLLSAGLLMATGCKDSSDHAGHDHHGHDHAGHDHAHDHAPAKTTATTGQVSQQVQTAAAQVKYVNVLCPVGDQKINPASSHTVTVEHEGVTYALCCADCVEPFKKDPAKYLAKLTEAGKEAPATTPTMPAMQ